MTKSIKIIAPTLLLTTLILLLVLEAAALSTRQSTTTQQSCFYALTDTFIDSTATTTNYGTETYLHVGNSSGEQHILLRFNLDAIPDNATIDNATLSLFQEDGTDLTSDLFASGEAWPEIDVAWVNQPPFATNYGTTEHSFANDWQTWDVTTLVSDWHDGTQTNFGIGLTTTSGDGIYTAREGDSATQPNLCIDWHDAQTAQLDQLRALSTAPVTVDMRDGKPVFIDMRLPLNDNYDPVERALQHLYDYRNLYGIDDPVNDLYLDRTVIDADQQNIFFGQHQAGVSVFASQISIHFANDALIGVNGNWLTDIPYLPNNDLSVSEIQAVVNNHVPAFSVLRTSEPKLMIFDERLFTEVDESVGTRLAWAVGAQGPRTLDGVLATWLVFIDAETSDLLAIIDQAETFAPPDKDFDIETVNNSARSSTCWDLPWETDDDEWFDENGATGYPGAGSDLFLDGQNAFDFSHETYNYFYGRFGRNSWDDDDAQIEAMVHVSQTWRNAAWTGGSWWNCRQMHFGDGYVTRDIFAHEFTHALIDGSADLIYSSQSGALNESFADVFGTLIEHKEEGANADWLLGEDRPVGGQFCGTGGPYQGHDRVSRDLANPTGCGDPDHIVNGNGLCSNTNTWCYFIDAQGNLQTDNDGVHTNSGIPNKVAHLIIAGGTHYGFDIDGLGITKGERLYYDTLTRRLTNNSDFLHARNTMIATARAFASSSPAWTTIDVCNVINAWASVGLGNPDLDCDGFPDLPSLDLDGDGILNTNDNCPAVPNPTQANRDSDTLGDACDNDIDGDTINNDSDNCPLKANTNQADGDADGFGDVCDDDDQDGIIDGNDNCPQTYNPDQANYDGDSEGDACDDDWDNDGLPNWGDVCPTNYDPSQSDGDGDGVGNACDNCVETPNSDQSDVDGDSEGDVCDADADSDDFPNEVDNCPLIANPRQIDNDENGIGLWCDVDELAELDGLRQDAELDLLFSMADFNSPIVFPIFPCTLENCPDWLSEDFNTAITLQTDAQLVMRVVDDQQNVVARAQRQGAFDQRLTFPVDPEYWIDDELPEGRALAADQPYQGIAYFLEIYAPEGATAPIDVEGILQVESGYDSPSVPTAVQVEESIVTTETNFTPLLLILLCATATMTTITKRRQ